MVFQCKKIVTAIFALFTVIFAISVVFAQSDLKNRAAQTSQGFKDISLTCKVTYSNAAELKKISSDFSKRYEFKTSNVLYKSPDKMKMEGKLGMVKVAMIINGDRKAFVVPSLHYSKKENIKNEPHKRQSDFDIGIFTDSIWDDYKVISTETVKGSEGTAYKIVFVRENAQEKNLVCWVDADTLKLQKLEKYESDGRLKSRFVYSNHKHMNNCIWVPLKIDIYNGNGKLGATTEYEDIKLNSGIPDSEFKI